MKLHKPVIPSSEVVGSLEELLMQILLRLPIKALMRFKLVSKQWQSLIISYPFSLQYRPVSNSAVGLFYSGPETTEYGYIHFNAEENTTRPPFRKLDIPEVPYLPIHHSCNGLLLCCVTDLFATDLMFAIAKYFVCNPTTNCFNELPRPGVVSGIPRRLLGINLAFDSPNSPFYKVVCVRESDLDINLYQVEIYSSEFSTWRLSGEPFESSAIFEKGVYFNGSMHWIDLSDFEVLYFNVDQESFGKIRIPDDSQDSKEISYFGESCDHLHLVVRYCSRDDVIVYEMKRDRSGLFVKYNVNLTEVVRDSQLFTSPLPKSFDIYSLVCSGKKESDALLVLQISRKVLMFNLECKTFEVVQNFPDEESYLGDVHDYIESLHMFRVPA